MMGIAALLWVQVLHSRLKLSYVCYVECIEQENIYDISK